MKSTFFTLILSPVLAITSYAQVTFSLNKSNYAPGETITATWTGRTNPRSTDWVGIYPRTAGVPDGNPASTIWKYTPGTAAGTVSFTNPGLAVNEWTAYFLANDGYTVLGSVPFTVFNAAKISGFTADHAFINEGMPITLSWVVDPGSATIQTLTLNDGVQNINVAGSNVLEVSPTTNTTYTLTLNGTVTARASVFKDSGNTETFNLGGGTHFSTRGSFVANWNGTNGNPDSWVAIYRVGEVPQTHVSTYWKYLNGTQTAGGAIRPSGSLAFTPAPGEYYAVLFLNGGYVIEQGPIRFSVTDQAIKPESIAGFVQEAGDFRIDWNSLPGVSYDVMTSSDLENWLPAAENIRAAGYTSKVFLPQAADETRRFFSIQSR